MVTMEKRCTGHCCKRFYLPYATVEEMEVCIDRVEDGAFIKAMLIKLGPQTHDVAGKPFEPGDEAANHYWTCKHYDTATGNCTAYDKRPSMCRDYPYGRPCVVEGCTASCAFKGDLKTLAISPNMERAK